MTSTVALGPRELESNIEVIREHLNLFHDTPVPYACGNRRGSERKVDLIDPLRSIEPGDLDTIHFREYAPLLHSKCVCRLCSLSSEELEDTSSGLGEAQSDHFQPEVIGELSTAPLY